MPEGQAAPIEFHHNPDNKEGRAFTYSVVGGAVGAAAGLFAGGGGYGIWYYNRETIAPAEANEQCATWYRDIDTPEFQATSQAEPDICSADYAKSQQQSQQVMVSNRIRGAEMRPGQQMYDDAHAHLEEVESAQLGEAATAALVGGAGLLLAGAVVGAAIGRRRGRRPEQAPKGPVDPAEKKVRFRRTRSGLNNMTSIRSQEEERIRKTSVDEPVEL